MQSEASCEEIMDDQDNSSESEYSYYSAADDSYEDSIFSMEDDTEYYSEIEDQFYSQKEDHCKCEELNKK